MSKADYKYKIACLEAGMNQSESRWFHSLLYEFPNTDPSDVAELALERAAACNKKQNHTKDSMITVI